MEKVLSQNLILPTVEHQPGISPAPTIVVSGPLDAVRFPDLGAVITELLKYLYPIAGIILFVYIIAAGFQWLTASGDPKKIEAARQRLTYAILGFILLIASPWVARIVELIFSPNEPFF
ncbi:hypothetical protein HYT02_02540 [Candidatus Gottesmanbacteria bacterium]|nr:hypothetical protein [Candidatus Gottesmanbacteria bacterium]